MLVRLTDDAWSDAVTFANGGHVQVQRGTAVVSIGADAPADANDGLILRADVERPLRDDVYFPPGTTFRYRAMTVRPTTLYLGAF